MILAYWKTQTVKEKLLILIILGLVAFGAVTFAKYEIANYRLIKTQKKQLEVYKDSLDLVREKLDVYISSGKQINADAKSKSKKINSKLKNDTEKINNTPVTDPELSEFLSEYEKRVKNK